MRHTLRASVVNGLVAVAVGTLLAVSPAPSAAEGTGTANGKVSAVDSTSLTVRVADTDMSFAVDEETSIIAPQGASARAAAAAAPKKAASKERPALDELVKVGQVVQVIYEEDGMRATRIRALPMSRTAR
jgi:hypothetical protein